MWSFALISVLENSRRKVHPFLNSMERIHGQRHLATGQCGKIVSEDDLAKL